MVQNTPFTVLADHNGVDTTGYRYKRNDVVVEDKPVSALSGGSISFLESVGLPAGTYTLKISAYNATAEVESDVLVLVVTVAAPAQPTNIRIVV